MEQKKHVPFTKAMGWGGGDAAKVNGFHQISIRGAEHRPDVVQTAHVVEHYHQRQFVSLLELFGREAVQFVYFEFTHIIEQQPLPCAPLLKRGEICRSRLLVKNLCV